MSVVELVVSSHRILNRLGVRHAFGGALALAYYAEPRGTLDVDVNIFVPVAEGETVIASFAELGFAPEQPAERWTPAAGVRLVQPGRPVALDLFFSIDEHYDEIAGRVVTHPFGRPPADLPFLSAEDLALFKLSFGRDKDWVDLGNMAASQPDLDLSYIERQLVGLRGPRMYPRIARLRDMVRRAGPTGR